MTDNQSQEFESTNYTDNQNLVEEEQLLTVNIFKLLSCDVQMNILTFLCIHDMYPISLSCKHGASLVMSPETDGCVWGSVAIQLGFNKEETIRAIMQEQQEENQMKNHEFPEEETNTNGLPLSMWRTFVHSNFINWDPDTRVPNSDIRLYNRNRTISCVKTDRWYTIRTNRKLEMGKIYCWEYHLDEHDNGLYNGSRVYVGIERSTYPFSKGECDTNKVIGRWSDGVSYSVGQHSVHRLRDYRITNPDLRSILYDKHFVFSSGDKIAMKLDLKNLNASNTASMHLFKNNEYFLTISDILTQDILYYPAISVIGHQRVTIRMKHPHTMLEGPIHMNVEQYEKHPSACSIQ